MDKNALFNQEVKENITSMKNDQQMQSLSKQWLEKSIELNYSYNFTWLGRPIIQYPQDMVAIQEIIYATKPELIIETGIAHGGSLIMNASLLTLLDYADAVADKTVLDPDAPKRQLIGIDIDIRQHNREAIETHPLSKRITMIEGSSIDEDIISQVWALSSNYNKIMLILDSNHTHEHVLKELKAYGGLVSQNCYCVVCDTIIADLPDDTYPDRPWGKGNNPKTAVNEYLHYLHENEIKDKDDKRLGFINDSHIENKLLLTVASNGYLLRQG